MVAKGARRDGSDWASGCHGWSLDLESKNDWSKGVKGRGFISDCGSDLAAVAMGGI